MNMSKWLLSRIVDKVIDVQLENDIGTFYTGAYKVIDESGIIRELPIIYKGDITDSVNIRINSACFTGDLFGCRRCDCHEQLVHAINYINEHGNGMVIYLLHQDGLGHGVVNKLHSYNMTDTNDVSDIKSFEMLNFQSDIRDYSTAAAILLDNRLLNINLITNNPYKKSALEKYGICVRELIPTISDKPELQAYLQRKRLAFSHLIPIRTEYE
jgi:3,4-dihydroxy 2-butanone 4-phosphate synthase/GTP cyclohydrolase II